MEEKKKAEKKKAEKKRKTKAAETEVKTEEMLGVEEQRATKRYELRKQTYDDMSEKKNALKKAAQKRKSKSAGYRVDETLHTKTGIVVEKLEQAPIITNKKFSEAKTPANNKKSQWEQLIRV